MNRIEIKAFVHRNRVSDVVEALASAGYSNVTILDVKGMLTAINSDEEQYSVEIGMKVVTEVKIELVCSADQEQEVIGLIKSHARTNQPTSGWIYVSDVRSAVEIPGKDA